VINKPNGLELRAISAGPLPEVDFSTFEVSERWLGFALVCAAYACRWLSDVRLDVAGRKGTLKADGTPTIPQEVAVEEDIRDALRVLDSNAAFVGEETGGEMLKTGITVSVDPVDGTWAFLSGMASCATAITVFEDGAPLCAVIGNLSTGEICYASKGGGSRLIKLPLEGNGLRAYDLPISSANEKVLINVHPSRSAKSLMEAAYEAWQKSDIRLVTSISGSPSAAIMEAAKGHVAYMNVWSGRQAEPFDLAAGALIMSELGAPLVDQNGETISSTSHAGPFVAAVDKRAKAWCLSALSSY